MMRMTSDERFWNRLAPKYAGWKVSDEQGYERTLAAVRDLLDPDSRVLELGCGTGTTALRLAPGVGTYLATDFAPGMIAIAEGKLAGAPVGNLSFRVATAEALAAEGAGRWDAVLAFNYLHLVPDMAATLAAIHDLLTPGGLFVTKTPCISDMNPLIRLAIPPLRLIGKAPRLRCISAALLRTRIEGAGFAILSCDHHGTGGRDGRPFIVAQKVAGHGARGNAQVMADDAASN